MPVQYTWYPQIVLELDNGEFPEDEEDIVDKCQKIHEILREKDKKDLISEMTQKGPIERYMISRRYNKLYGETLYDAFDDKFNGDLCRVLQLMSLRSDEAEAEMIHDAFKGMGIAQNVLYPILGARSNGDVTLIKKAYFKKYGKDLAVTLTSNLSGDYQKLMVMCIQGVEERYDPVNVHTEERIKDDVTTFYKAGEGQWGTDESQFFKVLCTSPPDHLKAVDAAYTKKHGRTLKKAAAKELGGITEDAVQYIIDIKMGTSADAIAQEIKKTTKGFGCDEVALMNLILRLIVMPDLFRAVMEAHETLFDKTLEKRLTSELKGSLENILLKLVAWGKEAEYE